MTLAAEWGLTHPSSTKICNDFYVEGNIFQNMKLLEKLPKLPSSCVESANILLKNRELYERDGIFPPSIIDYMASLLVNEKDQNINQHLVDLPADVAPHIQKTWLSDSLACFQSIDASLRASVILSLPDLGLVQHTTHR